MAITAPVLGGTTLPQVTADGYDEMPELRGAHDEMANGSLATDLVSATVKRRFELRWKHLTEAEIATITSAWSALVIAGSASFTSPRGNSYTVTHDEQLKLEVRWEKLIKTAVMGAVTLRLREV